MKTKRTHQGGVFNLQFSVETLSSPAPSPQAPSPPRSAGAKRTHRGPTPSSHQSNPSCEAYYAKQDRPTVEQSHDAPPRVAPNEPKDG
jgi:hypothetical protein